MEDYEQTIEDLMFANEQLRERLANAQRDAEREERASEKAREDLETFREETTERLWQLSAFVAVLCGPFRADEPFTITEARELAREVAQEHGRAFAAQAEARAQNDLRWTGP